MRWENKEDYVLLGKERDTSNFARSATEPGIVPGIKMIIAMSGIFTIRDTHYISSSGLLFNTH